MAVNPANAPGTLKIADLLANLDVDGDGDIDEEDMELAKTIRAMDIDGDGTITLRELVKIGQTKMADGAYAPPLPPNTARRGKILTWKAGEGEHTVAIRAHTTRGVFCGASRYVLRAFPRRHASPSVDWVPHVPISGSQ
jgi:hypothetical protein